MQRLFPYWLLSLAAVTLCCSLSAAPLQQNSLSTEKSTSQGEEEEDLDEGDEDVLIQEEEEINDEDPSSH